MSTLLLPDDFHIAMSPMALSDDGGLIMAFADEQDNDDTLSTTNNQISCSCTGESQVDVASTSTPCESRTVTTVTTQNAQEAAYNHVPTEQEEERELINHLVSMHKHAKNLIARFKNQFPKTAITADMKAQFLKDALIIANFELFDPCVDFSDKNPYKASRGKRNINRIYKKNREDRRKLVSKLLA